MATREQWQPNPYLNRSVFNAWGLTNFIHMLLYKGKLYGKDLQFLDERNTSKQCSGCGNLKAMPLSKRTYHCAECGLVMDRDDNSAVNILMRFLAGLRPHTGDPVRCAVVFTAIEDVLNTFDSI